MLKNLATQVVNQRNPYHDQTGYPRATQTTGLCQTINKKFVNLHKKE